MSGDECVLKLTGEIDMGCSDKIGDLGVGMLESNRIRVLVLDMSAVTFIDATGLGALVRMDQEAEAQGKSFSLRNPTELVLKTLRTTALDTVLAIEASAAPESGSSFASTNSESPAPGAT